MKTIIFAAVLGTLILSMAYEPSESSAAGNQSGVAFRRPIDGGSISCVFDSKNCGAPGKYHTGIDYAPPNKKASNILASTCGVVSYIQRNGANDHGLGNAVILKHHVIVSSGRLNTFDYYSLYAHLDSITTGLKVGQVVLQGDKLGVMGGTGYGSRNHWGRHLHFEVKEANVLHNPSAPTKTSEKSWGYTKSSASRFGYIDPATFVGSRKALCGTPVR